MKDKTPMKKNCFIIDVNLVVVVGGHCPPYYAREAKISFPSLRSACKQMHIPKIEGGSSATPDTKTSKSERIIVVGEEQR